MSTLAFRNVDADPTDDVVTWPFEALVAVVERGLVGDWQPVLTQIQLSPWGPVARRLERLVTREEQDAVARFFELAIERARANTDREDRTQVATRVRSAVKGSGLSQAGFAELVGTSPSRMSTYVNGSVVPSAAMLIRIERLANLTAVSQDSGQSPTRTVT